KLKIQQRGGSAAVSSASSTSSSNSSTSASGSITYTVRSGDTLTKIASRYPGVSANDIMKFNGIGEKIHPGMKIKIPTR
ncbi:MAG: LysM peptidoglycan-binding domain-containing protein, partial [Bacteroidales bacterium]|nr:LysM peptidoglycan-binding domain-containing protein [Bacteroidales bacterium]